MSESSTAGSRTRAALRDPRIAVPVALGLLAGAGVGGFQLGESRANANAGNLAHSVHPSIYQAVLLHGDPSGFDVILTRSGEFSGPEGSIDDFTQYVDIVVPCDGRDGKVHLAVLGSHKVPRLLMRVDGKPLPVILDGEAEAIEDKGPRADQNGHFIASAFSGGTHEITFAFNDGVPFAEGSVTTSSGGTTELTLTNRANDEQQSVMGCAL